jgi:hypothetical protein
MGVSFWIWLIVIAVTFIARMIKKQQQNAPASPAETTTHRQPEARNVTFEELLREIQATKTPPTPVPAPAAIPSKKLSPYTDYDDDLEEEVKVPERTNYNYRGKGSVYETYEKAKQDAFVRPSLEETIKIQDTVVRYEAFKGYQQQIEQPAPAAAILKDFHEPEGFKKAFIMSEILTRKF